MQDLKVGDIVTRKSYGSDILFKVVDIKNDKGKKVVILKGVCYRLEADAPESDLELQPESSVREYNDKVSRSVDMKVRNILEPRVRSIVKKKYFREVVDKIDNKKFPKPGKVLHVDGDSDYLSTCLEQYKKLGIEAVGVYIREMDQPKRIYDLLKEHKPDILILTGHDGVIKSDKNYSSVDNYRYSKFYIESVKEARRYQNDLDSLVIFAGACQSMYNKLIEAGANYASSPHRVLIHALDPVFICQKVALTSIDSVIRPMDVIGLTITGAKGIGGVETRGKYREGYPLEPYS